MEKRGREREEDLKHFVITQIREKGPISFAKFMEWCLYHPEHGYYPSGRAKIGKEGDYYTGPSVHPLFGQLIARQLFQMSELLAEEAFEVVEMGGGRGFLCQDILDWARKNAFPFYERVKYFLIEGAPHFLREQKERLKEHEREGKVFWMDPGAFHSGKRQIKGCFLSNELVDAFPVHRVVYDRGSLKEIYVTERDGRLEEQWAEPSRPEIAAYLKSMNVTLQEGQKAEVNLEALRWLEGVSQCLRRGFVVTIDYGYPAHDLYAPYRPDGTLLCYFQHGTSENPFERLGEQDITSHVNFTGLIQKGEEVGLRLTGFVPQYRFLIGLGILQEMDSLGKEMSEIDRLALRLSLKHLIEPEAGMGEVFKVLIQHKGIENPKLDGLRDLHSIPWSG